MHRDVHRVPCCIIQGMDILALWYVAPYTLGSKA